MDIAGVCSKVDEIINAPHAFLPVLDESIAEVREKLKGVQALLERLKLSALTDRRNK